MLQLLDLFSLDNNKKVRNENITMPEEINMEKIIGVPGINRSVLEILPELWEQQQYDDEYDLDSFLTTLKSSNQ